MTDFIEALYSFGAWAWARHHNPLSWWVRPLFLIPFCYSAYRKSGLGIAATLILLATSMFWFPVPETVDPEIEAFLRAEREYLLGEWDLLKIFIAMFIPLSFIALGRAFWIRSWAWGIGVLIFMMATKLLWSIHYGQGSGISIIWPASAGLAACLAFAWYLKRKHGRN